MDSLEIKVPAEELEHHLTKLRVQSQRDRKAKINKAPKQQQQISASPKELQDIESRNKKWSQDQDMRPGAKIREAVIPVIKPTIVQPIPMPGSA